MKLLIKLIETQICEVVSHYSKQRKVMSSEDQSSLDALEACSLILRQKVKKANSNASAA